MLSIHVNSICYLFSKNAIGRSRLECTRTSGGCMYGLWLAVGGLCVVVWLAVKLIAGRASHEGVTDAPVSPIGRAEKDYFRGKGVNPIALMRIEYVALSGEISTRDIAISKVYPRLEKFEAFCRLRQGQRTFHFAGVRGAIDLSSGEMIPDIASFLKKETRKSR